MMSPRKHLPPLTVFVALFFAGLALLALCALIAQVESGKAPGIETFTLIGEHLASAVIVAAFMGMTYEWFVHSRTRREFEEMLNRHLAAVSDALQVQQDNFERTLAAFRATNAKEVFSLLRDIAERQKGVPTLYYPARSEVDEFLFSTHYPLFQQLTSVRDGREQIVDVLREWIDPKSSVNLRFLGSDFIGLLKLKELSQELRDVVAQRVPEWKKLDPTEKSCLLNYVWAASRCEEVMYEQLGKLLLKTIDPFVQSWILFVPLQMPDDPGLSEIVDTFLAERGDAISCEVVRNAILAIGALHRHGINMQPVVERHRQVIERCKLEELAQDEMTPLPMTRPRRSLIERLKSGKD